MSANLEKLRRIIIPARLSYCYVAEPRQPDEEDKSPYYSTQLLIPETDTATRKKLQQAILAATMKHTQGDKVKAQKLLKNPQFKQPMRNAADEEKEGEEYKGMVFANANAYTKRPGCALKNRTKLTEIEDIHEHIYSGVHALVSVSAYYFKSNGSQGIALGLNAVMKDKDGERLDGSTDVMDEFSDHFDDDDFSDDLDGGLDDGGLDMDDDDDFGL